MAGAEKESAAARVPEEWDALVAEEVDMVGLGRRPERGQVREGGRKRCGREGERELVL